MQRLLGYVVFDTNIENITDKNYNAHKISLKVVCIPSIDERTSQRLLYLAKDVLKTFNYTDFDKYRKDKREVVISVLYYPDKTKSEIYCTGVVKNKLSNPNDTYLQKQLLIVTDYFRKDMLQTRSKNAV